jgi:hypothetical protein
MESTSNDNRTIRHSNLLSSNKMSKFSRSGGVKSAKIRSGGVRTGPSSTFAAMASLCEEEVVVAVAKVSKKVEMTAEEAVKAGLVLSEHGWEGRLIERGCDIVDILRKGEWSWGAVDNMRSPQILCSAPQDLRGKDELMATFGPRGLEEAEDIFLTEDMSDEDYCDFMRWLYRHGWDVVDEIREGVEAYPAFFLCREWIPKVEVVYASVSAEQAALLEEDRENMLRDRERMERKHKMKEAKAAGIAVKSSLFAPSAGGGWSSTPAPAPRQVTLAGTAASKGLIQPKAPKVEEPLSAPGSDVGRRNGCPVGRFCKEATACPTAGCRYVHGNTIPRVNEPCKFGEGCGSGDAAKRATCLRMHPGETWTPELVIKRV